MRRDRPTAGGVAVRPASAATRTCLQRPMPSVIGRNAWPVVCSHCCASWFASSRPRGGRPFARTASPPAVVATTALQRSSPLRAGSGAARPTAPPPLRRLLRRRLQPADSTSRPRRLTWRRSSTCRHSQAFASTRARVPAPRLRPGAVWLACRIGCCDWMNAGCRRHPALPMFRRSRAPRTIIVMGAVAG